MSEEEEQYIPPQTLGEEPSAHSDNPLLNFKEAIIDPSWSEDTSSPDRQASVDDLVGLLEQPLDRASELAHLGAYKTEYPYGRGILKSRRYNTKFVRIAPEDNPEDTRFARRVTEDTGPIDTSVTKWEIPRETGEPPLDIFLRIKGSMRGDLKPGDPYIASIDGEPASRADVEHARNRVGTFFKQEATAATQLAGSKTSR